MRPFLLAAAVSIAACAQEEPRPPAIDPTHSPRPQITPAGDLIASEGELTGEYRVAGVAGQAIDLPYGITASITPDRIHLIAGCVNAKWSYHFEEGVLATERMPAESCMRGLNRQEEALFAALDGAERVMHLPSGAYEFSGTGPEATLFTQ